MEPAEDLELQHIRLLLLEWGVTTLLVVPCEATLLGFGFLPLLVCPFLLVIAPWSLFLVAVCHPIVFAFQPLRSQGVVRKLGRQPIWVCGFATVGTVAAIHPLILMALDWSV